MTLTFRSGSVLCSLSFLLSVGNDNTPNGLLTALLFLKMHNTANLYFRWSKAFHVKSELGDENNSKVHYNIIFWPLVLVWARHLQKSSKLLAVLPVWYSYSLLTHRSTDNQGSLHRCSHKLFTCRDFVTRGIVNGTWVFIYLLTQKTD